MKTFFEKLSILFKQLNSKTEQTVARLLFNNSMKIAVAESCTGGLISSRLTDISGSSVYTSENFITYANSAKISELNVKPETLEQYGAVSEECAIEMAEGLFAKGICDICIATTGVAGPTESENKPAGLLYVAIKNQYNIKVRKFEIKTNHQRKIMKYLFSEKALKFLIEFIKDTYAATNCESI